MADFRVALRALGKGRLTVLKIRASLTELLDNRPEIAPKVLRQIQAAHARGEIDDTQFAELRDAIESRTRASTVPTPDADNDDDSDDDGTIFDPARGDVPAAGGQASTPPDFHEERTILVQRDPPRPDGDASGTTTDSTINVDISGPLSVTNNTGNAGTRGQGSTGGYRTNASRDFTGGYDPDEDREIDIGTILADQFQLESLGGKGGMGIVYKARDLLFEGMRTTYVAVKILNKEFKRNPESFKALATEQHRQARLSHPNIVSVRGIHRDRGDVFMVMEWLDGESLSQVISKRKRMPGGAGFSFAEAWPVIRALGDALQYAHDNHLVHSDFKPGNCFWCRDGKVKVIDFGIARAVPLQSSAPSQTKPEGLDSDGERTTFSVTGALTVAYASLEMLNGDEPDPRDDLYALACVAYELLSLYHPFWDRNEGKKLGADDARERKLVPAPIEGLTKRQMNALRRGLAFERGRRTPDIRTFLRELEGRVEPWKNPWIVGPAAAILLGGPGSYLISKGVKSAQLSSIERGMHATSDQEFERAITELFKLDENDRDSLVGKSLDALADHTTLTVNKLITADDFDGAGVALSSASKLRKGWDLIPKLEEELQQRRAARIVELDTAIERCKGDAACAASADAKSYAGLLTSLRKLDAQHPRLKSDSVASVFTGHINSALERKELSLAANGKIRFRFVTLNQFDLSSQRHQSRLHRLFSCGKLIADRPHGKRLHSMPLQHEILNHAGMAPS